jgi:hypothetical protein
MYEVQLASYGLNPVAWTKEAKGVNGLVKAWNSYRELGQVGARQQDRGHELLGSEISEHAGVEKRRLSVKGRVA